MNKYGDDFDGLLDIIKDKLNNGDIDEQFASICLKSLDEISAKVNESTNQDIYNWGVDALYCILNELRQFELTNDYIVDPIQEEENLTLLIDNISDNINKAFKEDESSNTAANKKRIINQLKDIKINIKKLNKDVRLTRLKVISYLLTLSLLISVPIYTFFGIRKRTEYKTVYPTHETIYDTETSYENDFAYYHGMPVVGNVLSHNIENLEFMPVGETGYVLNDDGYHNCYYKIVERTPWTIINREAVREVRTCIIPVNEIGDVVNIDEFDTLYNTYNGTMEKEIILKSEISRSDRKFYADEENENRNTYEVIRYDQYLNQPVTIAIPNDYRDLYIILFSEFLIWLCIVEGSHDLIIAAIIKSIKHIKNTKELTNKQQAKLDALYNSYVSIFHPEEQKKKRRIKK